jgi:hypothetical protein
VEKTGVDALKIAAQGEAVMLIYDGPVGKSEKKPTEDFLKEFLSKDESYCHGSGDSCLYFEGDDVTRLIFFKDEPYGFFLLYLPDYLVHFDPHKENKKVFHNVGGEPMPVSTACYVTQEEAEKIILGYARSGKIPGIEEWRDLYEVIDYE